MDIAAGADIVVSIDFHRKVCTVIISYSGGRHIIRADTVTDSPFQGDCCKTAVIPYPNLSLRIMHINTGRNNGNIQITDGI